MHEIAYPGTFDPLTLGHESIIRRATRIFDRVVVAVARGIHKEPVFSLEERMAMIKTTLNKDYGDQIEVVAVDGLLATFLSSRDIKLVLRGMRSVSDFEFEFQLADINRRLGKNVETLFMVPDTEYIHVFSRVVREVAMLNGDVRPYVSEPIAAHLTAKFNKAETD